MFDFTLSSFLFKFMSVLLWVITLAKVELKGISFLLVVFIVEGIDLVCVSSGDAGVDIVADSGNFCW
jgi:hypothetical protein